MGKLVRDRIPEIIRRAGKTPVTKIASKEEYEKMLKEKLKEEVSEFLEDDNEEELSDVLEVVYSLSDLMNLTQEKLNQIRLKKAEERGRFKDKIILEEVQE
jgi:predicted house-cleaning noncanonical NTP pyrophosphatase (MazG superfamily)